MSICFSCFKEFGDDFDVCPFCGSVKQTEPLEPVHLTPGTVLQNRYVIGLAVGAGGFGIVYRAWDMKLETVVAVKEFFVSRIITRAAGEKDIIISKKSMTEYTYRKERFLAEARAMAKFGDHANIPNVFDFFEENQTAYIVMELLEGQPLNEYLSENGGKADLDFSLMIINEVGKALISLHNAGIIHRDVAPDNIFICSNKKLTIKLLDLGAAKLADSTDKFIDVILKPGYSPVEQYDKTGNVGVWTDVYALGATLYAMLTGKKPDESTNRKIEDNLPSPQEIDASIPENISNSVMKAMAIEKHMRFRSVADFLKALNGEKKVVTLKKERKRRRRRRLTGIIAACLVLALTATGVYGYYDKKSSEQVLKDATISVWYSVSDGSTEEAAMSSVAEHFMSKFGNVKLELKAIPQSNYQKEIKSAAESGKLPTLFESTDIDDSILKNATDLSSILKSEQAKNCLFIDQYEKYYKGKKRMPLGISVPMAFVVTKGVTAIDYSDKYFKSISDFGADTRIALDPDYRSVIQKNIKTNNTVDKSEFLNNTENTCAVMLSSSMSINEVRNTLTNYQKSYVFYKADKINCEFTYEFSIGGGNKNQIAAAKRLLSWMLGNVYQNTLMISKCSDGQIPINSACFNEKINQNNYAPIKDIYKNFTFSN